MLTRAVLNVSPASTNGQPTCVALVRQEHATFVVKTLNLMLCCFAQLCGGAAVRPQPRAPMEPLSVCPKPIRLQDLRRGADAVALFPKAKEQQLVPDLKTTGQ
jgi:hypothetical protein